MKELVINIPATKLPHNVHICHLCGGSGQNYLTGSSSFAQKFDGSVEIRCTPPSPCLLCDGYGKVKIEPYTGE